MEQKDRIRKVTTGDAAHQGIHSGVAIMREAVGSTYGPGGRNVLIKKKYVAPILTRDGVTVARDIAGHGNKLPDGVAGEAAKLVYQASEKTNKTAGDGTTATVVLLADLYERGYQHIVAGEDAMVLKRRLDRDRERIVEFVKGKSVECDKKMLDQVSVISCGDDALGRMISDLVWDVGADGTITISYHNAPNIQVEKVAGYLFNQGFRNLQVEVEFEAPMVFVTQKRMATRTDIVPILELMSKNQKQFVIVGDVAGAALETLIWAIQHGDQTHVDGLVIAPPAYGADGHEYFEDIAAYTKATLWLEGDSFKDVRLEDFGQVAKARISRDKAVLFGYDNADEAVSDRIEAINKQMKSTDMTPSLKETLEQRKAKLAGKVSIIKVGAATEVEREELFFRVEDAVEACKSALSSGIVAGCATTLLFASREAGLEPFVREALQGLFRLLMSNAAEDAGYRLQQVLKAGYGKGFNLREMTAEPIDLLKAGVVDATKVVVQTVENAFSVAGALLTTGTIITEEDEEPAKAS